MSFSRIFVTVVVVLVCANSSSCAPKSEDQQKDQYAAPSKDTASFTTSTTRTTKTNTSNDKNQSKPLETMYADQPPRTPIRHHRAGTSKGVNKKLRGRNYGGSLWQDPSESLPPAYFYSSWTPATYTLNRPYFIPAWGPVGGVPIYFPPQPLLVNPGYPLRNPPPNREYLPPYENPPSDITTTPAPDFEISNKFGSEDDAPVWDLVDTPPKIGRRPASGGNRIPTRRPRPPNSQTSTFPSVVHRPTTEESNGINSLSASKESDNKGGGGGGAVASSPPVTNVPGRCVWAIISCCSGASQDVTNVCFEQLGCSGPFWDKSPCDSEFAKAAINAALEFYKTGN